ncbi:hypothetical protein GQ607_001769 [Colletotrichum asianum]|uniref:Secreted protein n=1 Tax=Colletotrichum asianum TaxID=702518 RepID=A0A8H3WR95_9PEZI|nr:hypothetical protein GQ607_001769 [Colletotrichum asianum]
MTPRCVADTAQLVLVWLRHCCCGSPTVGFACASPHTVFRIAPCCQNAGCRKPIVFDVSTSRWKPRMRFAFGGRRPGPFESRSSWWSPPTRLQLSRH